MSFQNANSQTWKSAELLIAFHRNKDGTARDMPFLWSPKATKVAHHQDVTKSETVVRIEATDERDVQMRLQGENIVIHRDEGAAWRGVAITDSQVSVKVGDVWITVGHDGSITRSVGEAKTFIEADGSILKIDGDAKVSVSADGATLTRATRDRIEAVSPEGLISRKKS